MTGGAAPDSDPIKREKAALRAEVLARRDALDAPSRDRASREIINALRLLPAYRSAGVVAAYASFGSEFQTIDFLRHVLDDGKMLLLPRIDRQKRMLELHQVADLDGDLVPGVWGIREPAAQRPLHGAGEVDFMLVPGVAFTREGARLGYGGGFYDRLMASMDGSAARVAAAFRIQVVERIPETQRDLRVTAVLTESPTSV